jgi:hypothetical protein
MDAIDRAVIVSNEKVEQCWFTDIIGTLAHKEGCHLPCFNCNLDCFIVISPLLKYTCPAMFIVHEECGLCNTCTIGTSNAGVFINVDLIVRRRISRRERIR